MNRKIVKIHKCFYKLTYFDFLRKKSVIRLNCQEIKEGVDIPKKLIHKNIKNAKNNWSRCWKI